MSKHALQEREALQILLEVDEAPQRIRYKNHHTEPTQEHSSTKAVRVGKENISIKRDFLPKLNNSKEELKSLLKKLQQESEMDWTGEENNSNNRRDMSVKQKRRVVHHEGKSVTCALKSGRQVKGNSNYSNNSGGREGRSILEVGKGDDIRTLMRQNNYSTNTLNLKTMNILQQINSKNYHYGGGGLRNGGDFKVRKNMVAFLRKVA